MLQVDKVISPLHSLDGSSQPLSAPLTDEMWRFSVINAIMFLLRPHSAVCLTTGDHITASSGMRFVLLQTRDTPFSVCTHLCVCVCYYTV